MDENTSYKINKLVCEFYAVKKDYEHVRLYNKIAQYICLFGLFLMFLYDDFYSIIYSAITAPIGIWACLFFWKLTYVKEIKRIEKELKKYGSTEEGKIELQKHGYPEEKLVTLEETSILQDRDDKT